MIFQYSLPTKILFEEGCISKNKQELVSFGRKAFIVTGKSSGKLSGALDDITCVLDELNIKYYIFDKVENNPTLESVDMGGKAAKEFSADFIVGLGGGSPIDAAKGIAVLAANDINPLDLFTNEFNNKPLPIVAIPTTAGTGSEVTPYSVLTRTDLQTKKSFGNIDTFPKLALMDPKYTMSLNRDITVNTAVDAFSHGVESYLNKKSTIMSDIFARQCIVEFAAALPALVKNEMDGSARNRLLYCSMLGGMAISHTGTTIVHAMGYSLTYFRGIPHGKANGLLMKEYFDFNYPACREKIDDILAIMGMKNTGEFGKVMWSLLNDEQTYTDSELEKYTDYAMQQRSVSKNIAEASKEDLYNIYRKSLKA